MSENAVHIDALEQQIATFRQQRDDAAANGQHVLSSRYAVALAKARKQLQGMES